MVVGRFVFVPVVVVVTITEMMERPFIWWFESNVESCAHKIFQFEYLDLEYSRILSLGGGGGRAGGGGWWRWRGGFVYILIIIVD